jgi:hypothetical protein
MYNEERFFTPKLLNVLQPLKAQWLLHLQPASILINSIFPTDRISCVSYESRNRNKFLKGKALSSWSL